MAIQISTPIAEGRTAEIYLWDDRHILKLYRDWCPPDWVEYDARIEGAVYEAGIPSPEPVEIVEVEGRRGLIYERLEGASMLEDLNARPWRLWRHARSLAELHVKIHQQSIPGLPSYKDRLHYDIRNTSHLSEDLRHRALSLLDTLPDGQNVCHGDFHPGNVLMTANGPIVIDWMTACSGSRWTDLARSSLLLSIGAKSAGKQLSPFIRMAIRLYHRTYLNQYRAFSPDQTNEMDRWTPVIAAARLKEEIAPERQALLKMVQEG
jgi:uncharacterized protein (TIGR02172 family)